MITPKNTISSPEISKIIKLNRNAIGRWVKKGKLPDPIYLVGKSFLWDRAEVFKILNELGYLTACNDESYNSEVQK